MLTLAVVPQRRLAAAGLRVGLVALCLVLCGNAVRAQVPHYPTKPIRLVVPFTPGGSSDILARAVGQKLTEAWGQPVVIDNVPGAGGSVGADKVARAAPDGYTLLMAHIGTLAVNPLIYPKLSYDPVKSFAPVAWVARVPNVLVVHPAVAARSVQELVALAKARPGQLNYASGGNGSAAHIATEYFKLQSQTFMVHVPYRGTAPAVSDLVAGQTQLMLTGAPAVMQFVRSGQLRAMAVSSNKRLEALPDLPTVAESGYPGFEADQWYGVVAPAGTPAAIVNKLNAQINLALGSPELKLRLQSEGALPNPTTPEAFGAHISNELKRWKPVVQAGRIRPD
jgi:tripartite-type tricarboxylate transporter receptor subunit TctC